MMTEYNPNYPSVTEVLDVLRKLGLENWFKYNTLEFIKNESEKGKTIGTLVHRIFQAHIEQEKIEIETTYPEEVRNVIESFMLFRKDNPEIKLKKSEVKMVSDSLGINATLDCIAFIGKEELVFDWKSGKCGKKELPDIYEEAIHQVSAYIKIYNELYKKDIQRGTIVALAKDRVAYNSLIITKETIEESFQEVFKPCLSIWNYKHRNKYVEKKFRGGTSNGAGDSKGQTNSADSEAKSKPGRKGAKLPRKF